MINTWNLEPVNDAMGICELDNMMSADPRQVIDHL